MRGLLLSAGLLLVMAVSVAFSVPVLDAPEDDREPMSAANDRAVEKLLGMITGEEKPTAKEGPVGGDWATKREEQLRKEKEIKEKAMSAAAKHALEIKREREALKKERARLLAMMKGDMGERKHLFVYPEEWAGTTIVPPTPEQKRAEQQQEAAMLKKKERASRERDRERIRELLHCDIGERKHKFAYSEPKEPTELSEEEVAAAAEAPTSPPPPSECRVTLNFSNGSSVARDYSPREQLAAIKLFVRLENPTVPFSKIELSEPTSGKKFTGPMLRETLESLGLCPTSVLSVTLLQ